MTKSLVKIAKELNVGTTSIVEFLNNSGFDIENKPNAKITDEMYVRLLKEFQRSIDDKEASKHVNIGVRSKGSEQEIGGGVTRERQETAVEEKPVEDEERPRIKLQRPTVLGKIDLSKRLHDRGKDKQEIHIHSAEENRQPEPATVLEPVREVEPPKETPTPVAEPVALVVESSPIVTPPEPALTEEKPVEGTSSVFRADTPELRGLKILGKIDTDRFEKKKKKDPKDVKRSPGEPEKPASAPTQGGGASPGRERPGGTGRPGAPGPQDRSPKPVNATDKKPADGLSEEERKKRKRKRKKVGTGGEGQNKPADGARGQSQDNRPRPPATRGVVREESKEVSQKEIEDKIKATMARLSGGGKKKRQKLQRDKRDRFRERQEQLEQEASNAKLEVTEFITVQELANVMDVPAAEVIMACLSLGVMVSINQRLDAEIIELVASEFGHEVEFVSVEEQTEEEILLDDNPEDLRPRSPIVTVMGHVDHGKTSLLDYIRHANVVAGEAGGITQHIGAYEFVSEEGKKVTFLDTPGHEAFTAMRARGAKVTDIAVIIVAADDSIMPQTKEAISHAQAAGVPIVFAINKIDKADAQPEKIKQELASMNFLVEEWGGKYQSQDISAKKGVGVAELLEKILLEAEILDLKANPARQAVGTVLEASLDKGRGYISKMLVQNGTLRIGDSIVAGEYSGKVRAMLNERGKRLTEAGPSAPVMVLGLGGAPQAGDRFKVLDNDQEARQIASKRGQIIREQANRATKRISLDEIGRRLALGNFKELNLIVKGDVDGSVEALSDSLIKLSIEKVQVNVIHKAVGQIAESDVLLASASDAIVIGFQVRPSSGARKLAEQEGVQIKTYSIIYEAIGEIRSAIEGMLEPTKEEHISALVEVREVYKISKVGTIAGCQVQEGKISRNSNIRLVRDGIVVFPTREGAHGEVASLRRFKEDVKEVKSGLECGIGIKNFNDIKVGDIIEVYEVVEIKQKL
ncbi:MAG: translation initiation factor IF-2 [Haliscomenobacter sp.]|nr:translation initiation factor IF-2 [Haliscomenobacter sp.]MBK8878654.1 translation initiation factor IF-2 [Haliscomenobacter sp.]